MKTLKQKIANFLDKIGVFNYVYKILVNLRRLFYGKQKINFKKKKILIGNKHSDTFLGYYDTNNFSFDELKIAFHQKPKKKKLCKYLHLSM